MKKALRFPQRFIRISQILVLKKSSETLKVSFALLIHNVKKLFYFGSFFLTLLFIFVTLNRVIETSFFLLVKDKFELIESIYYSNLLKFKNEEKKRRLIDSDELREKQRQLLMRLDGDDFDAPNPFVNQKFNDFSNNLTQPTPQAKRDGYNKNLSPQKYYKKLFFLFYFNA